jgi:hypothetical protein
MLMKTVRKMIPMGDLGDREEEGWDMRRAGWKNH